MQEFSAYGIHGLEGLLTFGLIAVPIRLFAAARTKRVGFHQIHRGCDTRIREQLYCPTCERTVEHSEIVRGYEIDKNRWIQAGRLINSWWTPWKSRAMRRSRSVGMHQRQYVVVIRPRENRAVPGYGQQHVDVKPREIQLADQLVKSLTGKFDPKRYSDEYQQRMIALIEAKREGRKVAATPHRRLAPRG